VGYAVQLATMTPSLSIHEALTRWPEKFGDSCNNGQVSRA